MSKNKKAKDLEFIKRNKKELRNRLALLMLVGFTLAMLLVFNFYQRQQLLSWTTIDQNLNLFLLINLNIILLITLGLLLLRHLTKVMYEHQSRVLGFKLKSKLMFAFAAIGCLPILLLFFIANGFLTKNLDYWFQGQFAVALDDATQIIQTLEQDLESDLLHYGQLVVQNYEHGVNNAEKMQQNLNDYRLDGVVIYDEILNPVHNYWSESTLSDELVADLWTVPNLTEHPKLIEQGYSHGRITLEDGVVYRTLFLLTSPDHDTLYLEVLRLQTGISYRYLEGHQTSLNQFHNLLALEPWIRSNYTAYLLLLTFMLIFAAVWFGIYLARAITRPIDVLLGGTRRVAEGDYNFQLTVKNVDDETGYLVTAFNKMTKELHHNRNELETNRQELLTTNQTLAYRNNFIELVLSHIQAGVFLIDYTGSVNVVNEAMVRLFNISVEHTELSKLIGMNYTQLLGKEQLEWVTDLESQLHHSTEKKIRESRNLTTKNGVRRLDLQMLVLEDEQQQNLGKLLVANDLTDLDRNTQVEAWREVAKRIAHEIKNPLTPIQLSAQHLRQKYWDKIPDNHLLDSCTKTIIAEVDALKKLVNEFSQFSRLPEINLQHEDINALLNEMCTLLKAGVPKTVSIHTELDPNIPKFMLDKQQVKRVLQNLIDNALIAIGDKGSVWINNQLDQANQIVYLSVADSGAGIKDNLKSKIFEPYVTHQPGGTGLGLAIVHSIVIDHGWTIEVTDNQPQGACFTICIPLQ